MNTKFLAPLVGNKWVRRAADALLVRYAHNRTVALDRMNAGAVQHATLMSLVRRARNTRFGRDHDFSRLYSVADYQARVPIRDYEYFWNTYWKDAYPNLDNVTWPGKIPYYALSSGTTSGTTKYIPVSWEMVRSNKKAGFTTIALFRHSHPTAKLFTGKFFFLGGCTDLRKQPDGSLAGDLSGIAAKEVQEFLRPYIWPPLELSLLTDWEEKMRRFTELSVNEPIAAFSGVPSWMLVLFDRLKRHTGKKTVAEVWPELRLIIHGGTKFDPYRDIFKKEIGSDLVKTCEVYPCSEAFVATEDPRYPELLRVVPDHDNFFEFVPVEDLGKDRPARHTLANVELGVQYAVVITSCAGVWSYIVGDTVAFSSRNPPLLRFTGRTKYFLSAFGEHLISEEVEKGVAHAAEACGAATDFHVGPIFPAEPTKPGHHLYMIEFATVPADLAKFARELDAELSRLNEDYEAHRKGDLTMLPPVVRVVKRGGFQEWMRARGKAGGANKVPRMDNTGKMTNDMAASFEGNGFC